jgi:tetratricopeptide (TPR) repeat protein
MNGGMAVQIKPKLIGLVERAYREEQALVASLSKVERSIEGEPDRWSAKDVIAHLAAWKERRAQNLAAVARGESPTRFEDYEQVNAKDFEEYRDWSWAKVLEQSADVHRYLVEQVEAISEVGLASTDALPWQGSRPLWQFVAGSGFTHPMSHLAQLYLARGQSGYATKLQEEAADLLAELSENGSWQGIIQYNLACHYALIGEIDRALEGLREALLLNPELTEWSKQDSDLASIRDAPGYQALYTE